VVGQLPALLMLVQPALLGLPVLQWLLLPAQPALMHEVQVTGAQRWVGLGEVLESLSCHLMASQWQLLPLQVAALYQLKWVCCCQVTPSGS